MARKKDTPQKAALREMMGNYLKENNVKVKDGTDVNSIMRDMMSIILEGALDQEMDEELGYSKYDYRNKETDNSRNGYSHKTMHTSYGDMDVDIPRDRKGEFEPQIVKKYQNTVTQDMEEKIISMYAKGMTTNDIESHMRELYDIEISDSTISRITDKILPIVKEWQERPLEEIYAVVFMDAIHYHVRNEGRIVKRAVYIAIGIKPNGHKEVIDYCIAPTENIEIWSEMLKGFKSRGLEQVELFLSDGVVGMKEAICQSYPKAHFQRCLVHVMRNISAKMRVDDRQKALDEFKQIHTQSNKEMAVQVLHEFYQNWEKAYKNVVRDLRQVEPDLLTFYNYPPAIRASIYSTNMIESFNNRLKRKTKPKTEFPTEQSLDTFIGVQAMDYNDRYFNRIHKGFGQVRDTLESYFD